MRLSTGKEYYANANIFGVTQDGELSAGYDNMIFDDDEDPVLTPAEKVEIATEMMRRWESFKIKWMQR